MENKSLTVLNWPPRILTWTSLSFFLFSFATREGSPQQREPITVGPYYLTPLSTFPVGGNRSTRRKPTTFGRALTILFHTRTGFESKLRWTLLWIELGTSEVKGKWSDHYSTLLCRCGCTWRKRKWRELLQTCSSCEKIWSQTFHLTLSRNFMTVFSVVAKKCVKS